MQSKVEICGVNTAKLKILKNAETIALLKRTKEGDLQGTTEIDRRKFTPRTICYPKIHGARRKRR